MPYVRLSLRILTLAAFAFLLSPLTGTPALAQDVGRWADANDPVAKQLIEAERKWAVLECEPSNIAAEVLADDFVGTSPDGPIYTKADALAEKRSSGGARACKLLSARVRYFGPGLAMVYGKETSTRTSAGGKEYQRTLIWTDTWLKRNGRWQIIAVQDMNAPDSPRVIF